MSVHLLIHFALVVFANDCGSLGAHETCSSERGVIAMSKYDVTRLNLGIEKCLAVTTNPRHRFLLRRITGTGSWRLRDVMKKSLRRK
jgi:hypothetical protein